MTSYRAIRCLSRELLTSDSFMCIMVSVDHSWLGHLECVRLIQLWRFPNRIRIANNPVKWTYRPQMSTPISVESRREGTTDHPNHDTCGSQLLSGRAAEGTRKEGSRKVGHTRILSICGSGACSLSQKLLAAVQLCVEPPVSSAAAFCRSNYDTRGGMRRFRCCSSEQGVCGVGEGRK